MDQQPWRRRGNRRRRVRWGRVAVAVLGLAMAIIGLVKLIGYGIDLLSSRQTTQDLREVYYAEATDEPIAETDAPTQTPEPTQTPAPKPEETPAMAATVPAAPTQSPIPRLASVSYPDNPKVTVSSRFKALRKESKYIVGWLSIQKMLDEAVVQRDNIYYLDHDALGKKNVNGALFLDSGINMKTRPYTYIIYGHNMKSGAMFGNLRNYENSTFYHNDPFITFDTMYEGGRYVIFAVGTVSVEEWGRNYLDFYALRSANVSERQAAIDAVIAASVHTCPIDVQVDDQLLVLVTCVEKDEYRRVVVARRVRDGEDEAALKKLVNTSRKR